MSTQTVTITATLQDSSGILLAGATIAFYSQLNLSGGPCAFDPATATSLGSATTNASGVATLSGIMLASPDTFCVFGVFAGSGNYSASEGDTVYSTSGMGVSTQITSMVIPSVAVGGINANADVTGKLTAGGLPVPGAPIQMSLNGTPVSGYRPVTQTDGSYSVTVLNVPFGTNAITASYLGSATYLASSSTSQFTIGLYTTATGVVGAVSGIVLAGGIVAAVLGATSYLFSRYKKKGRRGRRKE